MVGKKETSGINFANWLSITRMLLAPIFMWAIFSGYYITGLVLIFLATLKSLFESTSGTSINQG